MKSVKQLSAVDIKKGFEIQISWKPRRKQLPELSFILFIRLNMDMDNIACRDVHSRQTSVGLHLNFIREYTLSLP